MTRKKPPYLRLLEGNPGKRPIRTKGVEPKGKARRPAHITGYAAEVWDRVVQAMPAGTFRATDTEILAAYCSAAADFQEASYRLMIEGEILTSPRGRQYRNPWAAVRKDAAAAMARIGPRLGLDPIARENLNPTPEPPPSKFTGLVGVPDDGETDDDD